MPAEIEIKLNIQDHDLEEIRERILKTKAELFKKRHLEVDEYFDKRNVMKNSDQLLRLRSNTILCYKGAQQRKQKLKIREEIEVMIDDGDKLKTILEKLGYTKSKKKEKYRTAFVHGKTQITIDETPIGNFIEIEGTKETIPKIVKKLGFKDSDTMNKTYSQLWDAYKKKHNIKGDMLFINTNNINKREEEK
jgi:adenylate cyclase, class 2